MSSHIAKIQITNPCSEDWNNMDIDSVGRFCQSCMKSVVDFSNKTDEEITSYIQERKNEQICGRFYRHQVDRIRIEIDRQVLILEIPFWQKFLAVLLVCFGQDVFGYDFIFAQEQTDSISVSTAPIDSTSTPTIDSALLETAIAADTIPVIEAKETAVTVVMGDFNIHVCGPVYGSVAIIAGGTSIIDEEEPSLTEIPIIDTPETKLPGIRNQQTDNQHPSKPKKEPQPEQVAVVPPTDERRNRRKA